MEGDEVKEMRVHHLKTKPPVPGPNFGWQLTNTGVADNYPVDLDGSCVMDNFYRQVHRMVADIGADP